MLTYKNFSFGIFAVLLLISLTLFAIGQDSNSNIFEDYDGDGLSNSEESSLGTDYQNPDTDGDGFGDGVEVASGYDPLKPAPGDRLVNEEEEKVSTQENLGRGGLGNLTELITSDVFASLEDATEAGVEELSVEEFRAVIENTVSDRVAFDTLPQIDVDRIRIKTIDTDGDSEAVQQQKIDNANIEYFTETMFLMRKYLPQEFDVDSQDELGVVVSEEATTFFTELNGTPFLDNLLDNAEIVENKLYEISVPEELFDIHIEALQIFVFAKQMKKEATYKNISDDPFAFVLTLSQLQAFSEIVTDYRESLQVYIDKYNLAEIDQNLPL